MAFVDKTADFIVDYLFSYVDADELASNDEHLRATLAIGHNWNASSVDGTHKVFTDSDVINTAAIIDDAVTTAKIDTGAVDQTAIASSAVGQGEFISTTGAVTTTTVHAVLTLPGGEYGFYPQTKNDAVGAAISLACMLSAIDAAGTINKTSNISTSYVSNITLGENSAQTVSAQQRYIQASPPYNLGNEDIPLFIYALVNNSTGKIESTYIAEDPPWAYNGPKRIDPKKVLIQDGKKYLKRVVRPWSHAEAKADKARFIENLAAVKNPTIEYVEITHAIKNAGMPDVPHPFPNINLATHTVILLDPCSPLCLSLYELAQESGEGTTEISEILYAERIKFDNTHINGLITPPGVIGVKMRIA